MSLVRDTVREHLFGMLAWAIGGAAAMLFMGMALHQEMLDFPGGPQALALTVSAPAEAMRVLRWPAEHLETLGGYLTYHNVMLFSGFLALYGALQGAKLVRGPEERRSLESVLATGWSRTAVLRDRSLGFVIVLAVASLGIAVGTAWALAAGDAADAVGSLITLTSVALGAFVAFALGLLLSQVTRSARSAGGIAAMVLATMYLANNAVDPEDAFGWIRFATPFHWVNQSRALVPGEGADAGAMVVLAVTGLALLCLAAAAFQHRDYGSAVWSRRQAASSAPRRRIIRSHLKPRTLWVASLQEHWLGTLGWVLSGAAFAALMMFLQPAAMDVFEQFSYYLAMVGGAGSSPEAMYATFATDIAAPIVVAYVIAQAAGWVADVEQGRVEAVLAAPVSWTRLVGERLLSVGVGVAVITAAYVGTIWVGSLLAGADVSLAGLGRVAAMCLLLAWAVGGLAMLAVVLLRSMLAVTVLAVYVGFAYLLTWMIPMFGWPAWTERFSIFAAFGHPYGEWPGTGSILLLLGFAVAGSLAGAVVAARTPQLE